jgi:hypothetical protein
MQLNKNIIISFLCAFAPLRLGGIKFVRLCEQNNHKNEKNMKKQQKTDYFENTTKPSLFSGEPPFPGNLLLRNKPNFNHSNITATSYMTESYNALQTKPKNGANPNKPNFRRSRRSLGEDGYITTSIPLFSSSLWPSVFLFFLCGKKTVKNPRNLRNPRIKKTRNEPNYQRLFWGIYSMNSLAVIQNLVKMLVCLIANQESIYVSEIVQRYAGRYPGNRLRG